MTPEEKRRRELGEREGANAEPEGIDWTRELATMGHGIGPADALAVFAELDAMTAERDGQRQRADNIATAYGALAVERDALRIELSAQRAMGWPKSGR